MNLTILSALISAALAGAGGFGAAWKIQAANITQIELRQANERIAVQRAARAAIESNMQRVAAAQSNAADRLRRANLDNARSASALDSLRSTSAAALRSAADDINACRRITVAYGNILSDGSEFIQKMAGYADQCGIERQALVDAWAK